jgi:dynein light chain LC8-type
MEQVLDSAMAEPYAKDAISIALAAADRFVLPKDIARFIKQEFDRKYPSSGKATDGVYHCVVGKNYASECCQLPTAADETHACRNLCVCSMAPSSAKRVRGPCCADWPWTGCCSGAISHETRHYLHLKIDAYHVLLWKSKDNGPFLATDKD